MAKQRIGGPLESLKKLESQISQQTTETKNNETKPTSTINVEEDEEQDEIINNDKDITQIGEKNFKDFFNKDYSTKDSEPMMIHKDLKKIIEKISGSSSGTTQSSLTSNILMDWIQTHKKDIEKILKEQNKIII